MKSFESSSNVHQEVSHQLKQLTEQLGVERASNTKLSSDLAKSLELCLHLQLEIQALKGRAIQVQTEEKKYSQSLFERCRAFERDLELMTALKAELETELIKAKSSFSINSDQWNVDKVNLVSQISASNERIMDLNKSLEDLNANLETKSDTIHELNQELEKLSHSFGQVESSAQKQSEVMKDLMGVAENKIVEMKLALDKKHLESQDYYNHLQQALTQLSVLKQENLALKDYINKLNLYHQQSQTN